MNKIIIILTIITSLIIILDNLFSKNINSEGFTPDMRQVYRPYIRDMRTRMEPFYNRYYIIKDYMDKIHL